MAGRTLRLLGGLAAFHLATGIGLAAELSPKTLLEAEKTAGWRLVLDGETTLGWRALGASGFDAPDGALTYVGRGAIAAASDDDEFELSFEFKLEKRADQAAAAAVAAEAEPSSERPFDIRARSGQDPLERGSLHELYRPAPHAARPAGAWITFVAADENDSNEAAASLLEGLSEGEKAAGWKSFFDGGTLARIEVRIGGGDSASEPSDADRDDRAIVEHRLRLPAFEADLLDDASLEVRSRGARDPFEGGSLGRRYRCGMEYAPSFDGGWRRVELHCTPADVVVYLNGAKVREFPRIFLDFDRFPAAGVHAEQLDFVDRAWGVVGFQCRDERIALRDVKVKRQDLSDPQAVFKYFTHGAPRRTRPTCTCSTPDEVFQYYICGSR